MAACLQSIQYSIEDAASGYLSIGHTGYLSYLSNGSQQYTMPAIRIVLVDDHQIVLDGLSTLLNQDPSFDVMGSFSHPERALAFLTTQEPDILLTDYSLPTMTGIELIHKAKSIHPAMKSAVLSMHDEPVVVREALKHGINGYMLKNIQQTELKEALRKIYTGLLYVSAEITTQLLQQPQPNPGESVLTERELEVLTLIIKEKSNKQIADHLFISERTVETHRKNIFRKTGTSSLVGLVKYVFANKLIQ